MYLISMKNSLGPKLHRLEYQVILAPPRSGGQNGLKKSRKCKAVLVMGPK